MAEHKEYRLLCSGGRGGREPGLLVQTTDQNWAEARYERFTRLFPGVEAWMETRTVTDWERLD